MLVALCAFLLLLSAGAHAQTITNVTGTVVDPNGFPYAYARLTVTLSIPGATVQVTNQQTCSSGGFGSQPCYIPFSTTIGPVTLDATGSFALALYSNSGIYNLQGGAVTTQWNFAINISPAAPLPLGTGPQQFSVPITVSGASQSVSATLNAAAPNLSNISGGGASSTIAFDATHYGAVADGSTDNSAAITSMYADVNAVTVGFPVVFFHCQQNIKKCQYNYTDAGSTSPIHPTKASTVWCDTGVTLNDTGSAHMMDLGDGVTGYTVSQPFNVHGCRFISTGTITAGIFLNSGTGFIETGLIESNNFDALPSASTAILETAGQFSNMYINDNQFRGQGNFLNLGSAVNNIITVSRNQLACVDGSGNNCNGVGGLGILVGGEGSIIADNTIVFFSPLLRISQAGSFSHISGNNLEGNLGTAGPIQYGLSGDSTGSVEGVVIDNNSMNMHVSGAFISPTSGSASGTTLQGWNVHDNRFSNGPTTMVSENAIQGQRYNQANGNWTLNFLNWWTNTVGLTTANAVTPEPWFQADSNSYSDTFQRANGALGGAWITVGTQTALAITSNVVTCSATCAGGLYGNDISQNQRNSIRFGTVPTGTDFVGVYSRFTQSTGTPGFSDYQCFYQAGTGIKLVAVVSNAASQLGSTYTTVTPVAGDILTLESIGGQQTCYLRHATAGVPGPDIAVVGPIADATVAAGFGGIEIGGTSGTVSLYTEVGLP